MAAPPQREWPAEYEVERLSQYGHGSQYLYRFSFHNLMIQRPAKLNMRVDPGIRSFADPSVAILEEVLREFPLDLEDGGWPAECRSLAQVDGEVDHQLCKLGPEQAALFSASDVECVKSNCMGVKAYCVMVFDEPTRPATPTLDEVLDIALPYPHNGIRESRVGPTLECMDDRLVFMDGPTGPPIPLTRSPLLNLLLPAEDFIATVNALLEDDVATLERVGLLEKLATNLVEFNPHLARRLEDRAVEILLSFEDLRRARRVLERRLVRRPADGPSYMLVQDGHQALLERFEEARSLFAETPIQFGPPRPVATVASVSERKPPRPYWKDGLVCLEEDPRSTFFGPAPLPTELPKSKHYGCWEPSTLEAVDDAAKRYPNPEPPLVFLTCGGPPFHRGSVDWLHPPQLDCFPRELDPRDNRPVFTNDEALFIRDAQAMILFRSTQEIREATQDDIRRVLHASGGHPYFDHGRFVLLDGEFWAIAEPKRYWRIPGLDPKRIVEESVSPDGRWLAVSERVDDGYSLRLLSVEVVASE